MRTRTAIALGLVLVAGPARAQTPAPVVTDAAAAPVEVAPAPAPDASAATLETTPALAPDAGAPGAPPTAAATGLPPDPGASGPGPSSAAAAAPSQEMTEAELLELGFNASDPAVDTSLRFSGFIDFGMQLGLNDVAKAALDNERSFAIGNLNLYVNKNLSKSVRTMAEIRFLYLPNGAGAGAVGAPPVSTSSADYADFQRPLRWGGVEIERVYLEWEMLRYLTIRGGQYLTPYGVWNVDHGSPTIIPAVKPFVIGIGFFPERQTGLELYGRADLSDYSALGYHFTMSNGTGPASEWKDLDKKQAFGGRAFWEYRKLGELRVGSSVYYGRNTDGTAVLTLDNGEVARSLKLNSQSDVLALGLDLVWKYRGIHLQWEWASAQRKFTPEGRVLATTVTGATAFPPDAFNWGTYLLAGYRFDWLGVMPFFVWQSFRQQDGFSADGYYFGLNVRPIDALTLKLQIDVDEVTGSGTFKVMYWQAAWAF
jgi:hypothetical protein